MKCLDQRRVVSGRILSRLVYALLECLLLLHTIGYVPPVESNCIWYGLCRAPAHIKAVNCFYEGPPKPVQDETWYILNKYCPQFASGPVCCDNDQLIVLNTNIALATNLLGRCPSCLDNFMLHICGMTCSPDQSDFIKPVSIEQFNSTHKRVTEIDYYLSATYKDATFNSCQEVPVPEYNGTVFDLMCGEYGADYCTADRLFQFLGDSTNPFVPFQVNYVDGDELSHGYAPYNPPTRQRGWTETEQGCKKIEHTTSKPKSKTTITPIIITANENNFTKPNKTHNFSISEKNYTTLNKFHDFTKFNTTDIKDKTACCTFNCEMLYRHKQRSLQVEEDYYSFKKDYLTQKLILLKEQTEALKTLTIEFVKMTKRN